MTKYENKELKGTTLVIEDCFFINCVLRECDLFYSGGDAEFVNLRLENCRWHFRGAAQKTFQLMQNFGMLKAPQIAVPSPVSSSIVN